MRLTKKISFWVCLLLATPVLASAHGVGQVYNLPIPLRYYLGSAGLAVALSFFIFAYFLSSEKKSIPENKINQVPWLPQLILVLRILLIVGLFGLMVEGIFGPQNSTHNLAPTYFWIFFLQGFSILSLLIGNIWYKLNPFKTLTKVLGLPKGQKIISPWFVVILILGLYWFELASGVSFLPSVVGITIFAYTILNIFGSTVFANWFLAGELFNVLFGFIGKLAFFEIGDDNRSIIYLPLSKRLAENKLAWHQLAIALVLLAGTSFDSLKETATWFKILKQFGFTHFSNLVWPNTLGLVLSVVPFAVVYLLVMWLMQKMTKVDTWQNLAKQFGLALIPIAFGYTLAHNFSLIVLTVPQAFGASGQLILSAKAIWFVEIGFVVLAHIAGTLFAHIKAIEIMPNPKKVLVSQYPTLILMVVFTVTTLWLLAQPLVISK